MQVFLFLCCTSILFLALCIVLTYYVMKKPIAIYPKSDIRMRKNVKYYLFVFLIYSFLFIFTVTNTLAAPTTTYSQAFNCKESEILQGYLFGKTATLGLEVNGNHLNFLEAGTDEEFTNSINEYGVSLTNEDTAITTMILIHEDLTTTYVYFLGVYQVDYVMFSVYHSVRRTDNNDSLSHFPECGYWLSSLESYSEFLDNVIEDNFN